MELAVIISIIIAVVLFGVILCVGFTSKSRNRIMNKMMQNNIDMIKDITTGDMGERLKDLSSTAINIKKNIIEENAEALREMAEIEADIQKGAIKTKVKAAKEGFKDDKTMFCKHCGAVIDVDSKFCKECGKEQ